MARLPAGPNWSQFVMTRNEVEAVMPLVVPEATTAFKP
jgi:hypothetical protein